MIKSSNRDTPFSLTYGMEAVIPAEIGMPTLRTAKVDLVGNNEALEINLDLLEEKREEAAIREAKRKLGPKWEGPYEVTKALGKGAYKLRDRDGKQLPRTWNISNLKKCDRWLPALFLLRQAKRNEKPGTISKTGVAKSYPGSFSQ
nr:hypothetical protein [Tanacetum cinerariifolium]